MNLVDELEVKIKEEIKTFVEDVVKLEWDKVFFNGGEIDFHDHELSIRFWHNSYGEEYYFLHDYEMNRGCLLHLLEEGDQVLKEWGNE